MVRRIGLGIAVVSLSLVLPFWWHSTSLAHESLPLEEIVAAYRADSIVRSRISVLPLLADEESGAVAGAKLVEQWLASHPDLIVQRGYFEDGFDRKVQPLLPGMHIDDAEDVLSSLIDHNARVNSLDAGRRGSSPAPGSDGLVVVVLPRTVNCPSLPTSGPGLGALGLRVIVGAKHLFVCSRHKWDSLAASVDAAQHLRAVVSSLSVADPDAWAVATTKERATLKLDDVPSRGGIASSASPRVGATKLVFTLIHSDVRSFDVTWDVDGHLQRWWPGLLSDVARVHNGSSVVSQVVYSRGALENATNTMSTPGTNSTEHVLRQSKLIQLLQVPGASFSSPADQGSQNVYHFVV